MKRLQDELGIKQIYVETLSIYMYVQQGKRTEELDDKIEDGKE